MYTFPNNPANYIRLLVITADNSLTIDQENDLYERAE